MATTQLNSGLDIVLDAGRTFFHQKIEQIINARTRRKVYRVTLAELSALTDRDLNDLGIARTDITRLAREAANVS